MESVASKDISNGESISTATHVRCLVTRRHQMDSLLAQIAEMKSSLTQQFEKVSLLLIALHGNVRPPYGEYLIWLYQTTIWWVSDLVISDHHMVGI